MVEERRGGTRKRELCDLTYREPRVPNYHRKSTRTPDCDGVRRAFNGIGAPCATFSHLETEERIFETYSIYMHRDQIGEFGLNSRTSRHTPTQQKSQGTHTCTTHVCT